MQKYEGRFGKLPEDQKLSKLCSEASLNLVEDGQFSHALSPNGAKNRFFTKNTRQVEVTRKFVQKGGSKAMHDSALKVYKTHGRYSVEVKAPSLFEDHTTSALKCTSERQCRSKKKELRGNPLQRRDQY